MSSTRPNGLTQLVRSRAWALQAQCQKTTWNLNQSANVVMNDAAAFIEVQGTAEGHAFRKEELDAMLELAAAGILQLLEQQRFAIENHK